MLSNMKATGRSGEETQAALSQFILNCPATNPDAEEVEVNVDEFEHTEVEQRARRDQQRVLAALARHRQQPAPDFDLNGPVLCPARVLLNQAVDFCSATSVVMARRAS